MNQVINESFQAEQQVSTFSFFENNFVTAQSPGGTNNNGGCRFRPNGIILQAVLASLRQSGIIKKDAWIFKGEPTVGDLLEFLKCYPYHSEQARSAGDYFFRQILRVDNPSLNRTFAHGGHA